MFFDLKENLDKYFGEELNDLFVFGFGEEVIDYVWWRVWKLSGWFLKIIIDLCVDESGRDKLWIIEYLI